MILYRTISYSHDIEEVEAIRLTQQSYYFLDHRGKERRELINTSYYKHFKTIEEAKESIRSRERAALDAAQKKVKEAMLRYQKALAL